MMKKEYIIALVVLVLIIGFFVYKKKSANKSASVPPPPAQPRQVVYANNGSVSCNTYCGGVGGQPWNNELPVEWNGAKCVATSVAGLDCNTAPGLMTGLQCECEATGTGWNP